MLHLAKYNRKRVAKGLQPEDWPPYYTQVKIGKYTKILPTAKAERYAKDGRCEIVVFD